MVSDGAVLAIDTAAAQCAVACVSGGQTVRRVERVERGHAELLFPMIDDALDEARLSYAALSLIVCCTGPGSFAGTRIGVAAARGLALGIGCAAAGVTRFEALAAEARGAEALSVGVLLAGRGGAAFFQSFAGDGSPACAPRIVDGAAPDPALVEGLDILAGDGGPEWSGPRRCLSDGLPDPVVIARLGRAGHVPGDTPPAPLYLRPPDADLPREGPPRILD